MLDKSRCAKIKYMITLKQLNTLPKKEGFTHLQQCCASGAWVNKMLKERPFKSERELINIATKIWYDQCIIKDFKQAFLGHPKIGDIESLKEKYASTLQWAGDEQSKISEADMETIEALAKANELYEKKFGYIFIVSASGKSAEEMLAIIGSRLKHNEADEIYLAMNEQHKITTIRLIKLIEGFKQLTDLNSQITTHILDTSLGIPAKNVVSTLKAKQKDEWKPICVGATNTEGRILDLLPVGKVLQPGIYKMEFQTSNYFKRNDINGFYPEIAIQFEITDNTHYHIPLLISPFGYSTYRGS